MSGVSAAPSCESSPCERLLAVLEAESAAPLGSRERIESACAALRAGGELPGRHLPQLRRLATLAAARVNPGHRPIAQLICDLAPAVEDPWLVLEPLLDSHDALVIDAALHATGAVWRDADPRILAGIAARAAADDAPLASRSALETIAALLRGPPHALAIETLYVSGSTAAVRRLAARLLDLDSLPSPLLARRLLGDAAEWLSPYVAWSRATHADLLSLTAGDLEAVVDSLKRAEEVCGEKLLRELVGEIGWGSLNFGLSVRRVIGTSIGGSFALFTDEAEARLIDSFEGARRICERFEVVATGGAATATSPGRGATIRRFREYNLAHADLLARFLDVAPLTVAKVHDTVERMAAIVEDFQLLFAPYTDEGPAAAEVYRELREAIGKAVESESAEPGVPLSSELTRLVDMFEDPASVREVTTLHGLKRYLHQRGLKLGMNLAEAGSAANRTVTIAVATAEKVIEKAVLEYADFEPLDGGGTRLPFAMQVVVDEFARQLTQALQPLPKAKVFCYGNEVHYFVSFRNHPVFIRVDYSPPGRGGMVDLAYFGVSKYELDAHPNPALTALEQFFRRIDFDVSIESTRVHARYDKERAFDLGELCAKASALFRLAPYLMELDWIIGDLELSASARAEVAVAWSDFFASWGVIPYRQFLTRDRRGILAGIEMQAAGPREVRWDGEEGYRDRFTVAPAAGFWDHVRAEVAARGLERVVRIEGEPPQTQLSFEERVLRPLRTARERGGVVVENGELRPAPAELMQVRHPAECLARVLVSDPATIASACRTAAVVTQLERGVRFRTVGAINGYDVQVAALPLPGRTAGLHVLRDASGIIRIALWSEGTALLVHRDAPGLPWTESWSVDAEGLTAALRRANYTTRWVDPVSAESAAAAVPRIFGSENLHAGVPPLPGERLLDGVAASPGRGVGRAVLGLSRRHPSDVEGCVVICPSVTPEDGVYLAASAGIVSTGGGALSHAGLLALQYGKPALVVRGRWERSGESLSALVYRGVRYVEERREVCGFTVVERHEVREREERLRDGDLVVVDADEGLLRIYGNEAEALSLDQSLRQLASASRQLAVATSDSEVLVERGRRLKARHQLEKILGRLTDPVLARHAVDELVLRDVGDASAVEPAEYGRLLALLLRNATVGEVVRAAVRHVVDTLARRAGAAVGDAHRQIPDASRAWEVLALRLHQSRLEAALESALELVAASGLALEGDAAPFDMDLDALAIRRLEALRGELSADVAVLRSTGRLSHLRHRVEELERVDLVLGRQTGPEVELAKSLLADHDARISAATEGRRVLGEEAGGIELRAAAGGKAANLAEIARLGRGELVPPWFVVTDFAFREAFDSRVARRGPATVRQAVADVLSRHDLTNAQKALQVRQAWEAAELPPGLVHEVRTAYRRLAADEGDDPFVAVRSSAIEEDLESATRAGEFDTFLFVRGEDALIATLRHAWSGFWTERALHGRDLLRADQYVGGGVLVQKMIASRASGVLHTVNVAERRLREMVINAGLGLGEGVVSGNVSADRIIVLKEGDPEREEIRFRYLTADKRSRVVLNSRFGSGTALVETLHHQRLRPALEYVEICELVRAATSLENAYGFPLDIEFAIEGTALYLLQVRPIPTPFSVWKETVERWPLAHATASGARPEEVR